jgi:hypothetical protein
MIASIVLIMQNVSIKYDKIACQSKSKILAKKSRKIVSFLTFKLHFIDNKTILLIKYISLNDFSLISIAYF